MGVPVELNSDHAKPKMKWRLVCNHYISLYNMCQELHCLPSTGGLEDQDWLVVHFFTVIAGEVGRYSQEMRKKRA